ncbi:hypothetical protein [Actinophytocola sp. KF-1]
MGDTRDDWRARMAVRGGPITHALARAGWFVFAMLGAVVMVGVAVLYAANPGPRGADNSAAANFVGGLIVMVPIGAVIGALLGLPAQFAARMWLRNPTEAERQAARVPGHGLRPSGRWARSYETCARSVAAYHQVVATLPAGAGRDWLAGIGETLDEELAESLRLARLGESLDDGDGELDGTAVRVLDRLRAAERSFDETTERAAAIALELRDDSDFVRVRAQLDMLAEQTPHLRASDQS